MPFQVSADSLHNVVTDGRSINPIRDPPGQRSHYIPPGDTARETYRLATFKEYPGHVLVDVRRLAERGFYFTGYRDRVKCFSCGQCVEDWNERDDPTSQNWHKFNCNFISGRECRNIPIQSLLHQMRLGSGQTRQDTRPKQPSLQPVQSVSETPNAGQVIVHGPHSSRTTSVSQLNISSYQTATAHNARNILPPSVVLSTIAHEINEEETSAATQQNSEQLECIRQNSEIFPCHNPINPHMRSEESRLQTFLDHATSWPAHRIRATPRDIARAGMYYLGQRDRVKCWYCNGGLQNWERNDEGWEEHAKWYPTCEFVLQQRGPDFVHGIVARFPDIRRPIIRNPANPISISGIQLRRSDVPQSSARSANSPAIVDPREEMNARKKKIDDEMMSSAIVAQAKLMGFEERAIKAALRRRYEATDVAFPNVEQLIESILSHKGPLNPDIEQLSCQTNTEINRSMSVSNISTTLGINEIRRLEEERVCKICHNQPSSVVLLPCGHIACCVDCSENVTSCPICYTSTREKLRSFIV